MDAPTIAGIVGAIALAIVGLLGKSAATLLAERVKRRELETANSVDVARAREARPWALMESLIDDLQASNDRLSSTVDRLRTEIDRLREELGRAQVAATEARIHARETEALKAECEEERRQHEATVTRLRQEIEGLRG